MDGFFEQSKSVRLFSAPPNRNETRRSSIFFSSSSSSSFSILFNLNSSLNIIENWLKIHIRIRRVGKSWPMWSNQRLIDSFPASFHVSRSGFIAATTNSARENHQERTFNSIREEGNLILLSTTYSWRTLQVTPYNETNTGRPLHGFSIPLTGDLLYPQRWEQRLRLCATRTTATDRVTTAPLSPCAARTKENKQACGTWLAPWWVALVSSSFLPFSTTGKCATHLYCLFCHNMKLIN